MIRFLILMIIFINNLDAKLVISDDVNYSLNELQLASYNKLDSIEQYAKKYENNKDFDLYYEKNKYYGLYAVNVKNDKKKEVLKFLKEEFKDAYFINTLKSKNIANKKIIIPIEKKKVEIPVIDNNITSKNIINPIKKTTNKKAIVRITKKEYKYEVGKSFFKSKKYNISYEIFNALFKNNLENKEINFYLGRSAFELKKYNEAYSAFERILIKYPNENRAKLEIARIDFVQKRYKDSKKLFTQLKKENLPKSVQKKIDIYLNKIEEKSKNSFINGIYMLGLGYDSNINNRSSNDTFYIPSSSLTFTNSTKDEKLVNLFAALFINHKYLYNDNINFKNDILLYGKKIIKDSAKDIGYISYSPSVVVIYNALAVQYGLYTDFLRYDNQYYLNTYGITPKLFYIYNANTQFNFSFKYQKKINKINRNKNKDSVYKSFNINMNKRLNKKYTLQTNLTFENEKKNDGILTNVDFDGITYGISLKYKYSKKLSINPSIVYKDKRYNDINSMYLKKQTNKEYIYNISTLYSISNSWISKIDITHNNVKSNIDSSTYNKNTFSISIMKRF